MKKKIALLLCLTILIGIVILPINESPVYASDQVTQIIKAIGVMDTDKGNTDVGTDLITRARFAQMLINLSSMKDDVTNVSNVSLFSDVKKTYWAAGYIQTSVNQGWMFGYLNGTFKPKQGITLQEAVYGILKLLGYSNNDFNGNKANAIQKIYVTKGLYENIQLKMTGYLTVSDAVNLFYNALNATNKEGKVYASVLGYTLDSNNKINYLSLIYNNVEGPIVVDGNWKKYLPFSITDASIYKNGEKITQLDIKDYDVVYYSKNFKVMWVYDDKVTGAVESINPDETSPVSVTVAGTNYSFENNEVALRFYSIGDIKKGDTVTLILGKDGSVVDVLSIDEYNTTMTGVVLKKGEQLTEDNGNYTYEENVTFVDAAGHEHTVVCNADTTYLAVNSLVRVTYVNGVATVSAYIAENYNFGTTTFNHDASAFGNVAVASNVKILDLKDNKYISVYPERLADVILGSASIYYYEFNSDGELSQLILNNITGDMDTYGVFTGFKYSVTDKVSYGYMVGSKAESLQTNLLTGLSIVTGPKDFVFSNNVLSESYDLLETAVTSIGTTSIQSGNTKLPLAADYYVYILLDGNYILTSIDKISDLSKYSVKAYYDHPISVGGRVRVIVATSK